VALAPTALRARTVIPITPRSSAEAPASSSASPLKNRVLVSIENDLGNRCVDIFVRPDQRFGFEEFRSDVEDGGKWHNLGRYAQLVFASEEEALRAASQRVIWMARG
jgi:hypothetical protein